MRSHELAQWLLTQGDYPIFLFTGPGEDDTFAALGAFNGSVELEDGKNYQFTVLSSLDLTQANPEAGQSGSFVPEVDETIKNLLSE